MIIAGVVAAVVFVKEKEEKADVKMKRRSCWMSWIDLLRMSASNLKRRKLRTFLTVLGVVIGTASIVVMVSLGLGLQKSVYDEMEQSGGLTTINVTGSESVGDGMMYSSNSDNSDETSKYIDDNCVKKFGELEHVKAAAPIYETSAICLKGKYEGYISLYASTPEGLRMRDIKLADGGTLPNPGLESWSWFMVTMF